MRTRSSKLLSKMLDDKLRNKNPNPVSPEQHKKDMEKLQEPKKVNESDTPYHRISVTVSDPNHSMVSKRNEKIEKKIRVKGDRADAINKAKMHYKKQGYKVHDANYIEGYALFTKEDVELTESFKVGDIVIAKVGPHKGVKHTVIHVGDGKINVKPNLPTARNKYRLGAASGTPDQFDKVNEETNIEEGFYIIQGKNKQLKPGTQAGSYSQRYSKMVQANSIEHALSHAKKIYDSAHAASKYEPGKTDNYRAYHEIDSDGNIKATKAYIHEKNNHHLEESYLIPGKTKVTILSPGEGTKHELLVREPGRKVYKITKQFNSREEAIAHAHQKWGRDSIVNEGKDPFAGTPWSEKKIKTKQLADYKKKHGFDKPETKEPKSVVKDGKRIFESVQIDESKMSELHATIGHHMDKHINNYKKVGGAEALMSHAAKAVPMVAKTHGIEHKHAEKFVSDYIESRLNEEININESKELIDAHKKWMKEFSDKSFKNKSDKAWEAVHKDKPGIITRIAARLSGTKLNKNGIAEGTEVNESVSVKKQNYSWGKMMTVNHGHSFSIPLHPEHQSSIEKLNHDEKTHFKDETGKTWHATRIKDTIHFHNQKDNLRTAVSRSSLFEETEQLDEAKAYSQAKKILTAHQHRSLTGMMNRNSVEKTASKSDLIKLVSSEHQEHMKDLAAYDHDPVNKAHKAEWDSHYKNILHGLNSIKEETEQLDEISGATLGSYIQKAKKDITTKNVHNIKLDTDEKIQKLNAKISDYYNRREYNKYGESKHRAAIDRARDAIEKRKKQLDPEFPKSINTGKRYRGIEKAINKLQYGKMTEDVLSEMALDRKTVKGHTLELHQVPGGGRAIFHKKTNRIIYSHPDNSEVMNKWKSLSEETNLEELEEAYTKTQKLLRKYVPGVGKHQAMKRSTDLFYSSRTNKLLSRGIDPDVGDKFKVSDEDKKIFNHLSKIQRKSSDKLMKIAHNIKEEIEQLDEISGLTEENKIGTVSHFAGLVKKYNSAATKEHLFYKKRGSNSKDDWYKTRKDLNKNIKSAEREVMKHYGHLKDEDGYKLKTSGLDSYDTGDHVGFAKAWLKNNKIKEEIDFNSYKELYEWHKSEGRNLSAEYILNKYYNTKPVSIKEKVEAKIKEGYNAGKPTKTEETIHSVKHENDVYEVKKITYKNPYTNYAPEYHVFKNGKAISNHLENKKSAIEHANRGN